MREISRVSGIPALHFYAVSAAPGALVTFHSSRITISCRSIANNQLLIKEVHYHQGKNFPFVRLNVDHPDARGALRQYRVRTTPTFVLVDADGQVRANIAGWPGSDQVANAFDQLLAGG